MDNAQRNQLQSIYKASADLRSIVNDVLHLSELEAGKVVIGSDTVAVHELLQTLQGRFGSEAVGKGITFTVDPVDTSHLMTTDRRRLTQILSNLIKNALKFTEQGGVRVRTSFPEGRVRFEVHDTGSGIPEQDIPKLFKEFSQLGHTTAQSLEGTGLGLSITHKLTGMLGGQVGVESTYGQGSMFWVEMPQSNAPKDAQTAVSDVATKGAKRSEGIRVLLVEDNLINQQAFRRMLQRKGCTVTVAGTGLEAVDKFKQGSFDLVLMDIQMPEMDGIAATNAIRALGGTVPPIIGLSGNVLERDSDGRPLGGMDDLLVKPIVSADLVAIIEKWGPKP